MLAMKALIDAICRSVEKLNKWYRFQDGPDTFTLMNVNEMLTNSGKANQ
jgi:hypothetical protein